MLYRIGQKVKIVKGLWRGRLGKIVKIPDSGMYYLISIIPRKTVLAYTRDEFQVIEPQCPTTNSPSS